MLGKRELAEVWQLPLICVNSSLFSSSSLWAPWNDAVEFWMNVSLKPIPASLSHQPVECHSNIISLDPSFSVDCPGRLELWICCYRCMYWVSHVKWAQIEVGASVALPSQDLWMLNIDIDYQRCVSRRIQSWCHFLLKACLWQNVEKIRKN